MYQYHSVTPITRVTLVPQGAQRVATTRHPDYSFGLEPISEEELDTMAVRALHAGHDVWIVVVRNCNRRAEIADLYVLQQAV